MGRRNSTEAVTGVCYKLCPLIRILMFPPGLAGLGSDRLHGARGGSRNLHKPRLSRMYILREHQVLYHITSSIAGPKIESQYGHFPGLFRRGSRQFVSASSKVSPTKLTLKVPRLPLSRSRNSILFSTSNAPTILEPFYAIINASTRPISPQPSTAVALVQSRGAPLGDPVAVTIVPLVELVGVPDDFTNTYISPVESPVMNRRPVLGSIVRQVGRRQPLGHLEWSGLDRISESAVVLSTGSTGSPLAASNDTMARA